MKTIQEEIPAPEGYEWLTIPKRSNINKFAKSSKFEVYQKLSYFLKCKYFMKYRDSTLISSLVMDARSWMLKNKMTMDNEGDYQTLCYSVLSAYLVDKEELIFRQIIKDEKQLDNADHINRTVSNNLGRKFNPSSWIKRRHDASTRWGDILLAPEGVTY